MRRRSVSVLGLPMSVVLQLPLVYDERALQMADNAARAAESAGVGQLVLNTGAPLPPGPIGVPYLDARHRLERRRTRRPLDRSV